MYEDWENVEDYEDPFDYLERHYEDFDGNYLWEEYPIAARFLNENMSALKVQSDLQRTLKEYQDSITKCKK